MRDHRRVLVVAALLTACGNVIQPTPPLPALPFAADTLREQAVRPGVTRRFIYAGKGPWAIHVLDVDLGCYAPVAVKGAPGARGRAKTSTLMQNLAKSRDVIGGVNADFFLFTPAGVPSGALITGGTVVTGPSEHPVFLFTRGGVPLIRTLHIAGNAEFLGDKIGIDAWNRAAPRGLALFDAAWGHVTDTATSAIEVVLEKRASTQVFLVDTLSAGVPIPPTGAVLIAGRNAPASTRDALRRLRPGDAIRADVALTTEPRLVREAVGGRPVLVRDSVVTPEVDTQGGAGFATSRHPRTAVGITGFARASRGQSGRRILLVVVDGRQGPYSDGMTLRELANLMLVLGATQAINLDGGGSTTMVYADPDSAGTLRVANRPSDAQGERAVGNALAIVDLCTAGTG